MQTHESTRARARTHAHTHMRTHTHTYTHTHTHATHATIVNWTATVLKAVFQLWTVPPPLPPSHTNHTTHTTSQHPYDCTRDHCAMMVQNAGTTEVAGCFPMAIVLSRKRLPAAQEEWEYICNGARTQKSREGRNTCTQPHISTHDNNTLIHARTKKHSYTRTYTCNQIPT